MGSRWGQLGGRSPVRLRKRAKLKTIIFVLYFQYSACFVGGKILPKSDKNGIADGFGRRTRKKTIFGLVLGGSGVPLEAQLGVSGGVQGGQVGRKWRHNRARQAYKVRRQGEAKLWQARRPSDQPAPTAFSSILAMHLAFRLELLYLSIYLSLQVGPKLTPSWPQVGPQKSPKKAPPKNTPQKNAPDCSHSAFVSSKRTGLQPQRRF